MTADLQDQAYVNEAVLYMALEPSDAKCRLAFGDGNAAAPRAHRSRRCCILERTRHRNRLSSKLVVRGIRLPIGKDFWAHLEAVTLFDGSGLLAHLKAGLIREWERLQVVQAQLRALELPIGALIKRR